MGRRWKPKHSKAMRERKEHQTSVFLESRGALHNLRYAQTNEERCKVMDTCVLCVGHPPPCYLLEWLHEPLRSGLAEAQKPKRD